MLAASCADTALTLERATLTATTPHEQCALRLGEGDGATDALPFPGEWTTTRAWCFRASAPLALGFELPPDEGAERGYALDAHLARRDPPRTTVWDVEVRRQRYAGPVRVSLPALPPGLGVYTLTLVVTADRSATGGARRRATHRRTLTVYGVLDAPVHTAWIPVLDLATRWAAGATSAQAVALTLTRALHSQGSYRVGHAHTRDFGRGDRWQQRFYLRDFLLDPDFPRGQCDEFAAFLQVLMEVSGVADARVERSGPPDGLGFRTHAIVVAGAEEARPWLFAYHAYVVSGAEVHDAAVTLAPDVDIAPLTPERYRTGLVDALVLRGGERGVWSPSAPFRPVLSASAQGD